MKPSRGFSWRRNIIIIGFLIFGIGTILYLEQFTQFHLEHTNDEIISSKKEPVFLTKSLVELLRQHASPYEVNEISKALRKQNVYSVEDLKSLSQNGWELIPLSEKTKQKLKSVVENMAAEPPTQQKEPDEAGDDRLLPTPREALQLFKQLVETTSPGEKWLWKPEGRYRSMPYQPTIIEKEPPPPKPIPNQELPPKAVKEETKRIVDLLKPKYPKLASMFEKCYPNTLETTTTLLDDGTTFIITGDIDLMWLRDSSAQVHHYLNLAHEPDVQRIIEGLIKRQSFFITKNPYGSSFRLTLRPEDDLGDFHVGKARNMYCSMHNYELDSLCYHIDLSYHYWRASGRSQIFSEEWFRTIQIIYYLFIVEQDHSNVSPYRYIELPGDVGPPVTFTGMTWSAFRPSDDQTQFGYLIPSNIYAAVVLGYLEQICKEVLKDETWEAKFKALRESIENGIYKHGVVQDAQYGQVFAYEVDGRGGVNIMDDANVPSLLSIPYLNYSSPRDPDGKIAENTRKLILSHKNQFYYEGKTAKGIGSPHTPSGYIWHMSLIMEGFTTDDWEEKYRIFQTLEKTDADTNFMHESFHPDNPSRFTRSWFAWANSLFAELVIENLDELLKYDPPK